MDGARRSGSAAVNARASSRDLRQLRRLAARLRPYRAQVAGAGLALVVAAGAVLSMGVGLRHVIDGGFVAARPSALTHAVEAVLIVVVVLAAATFARSYLVAWLGERVMADLRRELFSHVIGLSPGFFELTRTGEVLSRLTTDTSVIQTVIGSSVTQALRNLLLAIGGLILLVITNPRLTGLICIVVPVAVVPIIVVGRLVRRASRAAQDKVGDVSAIAEEMINSVRTVQSFAQERRESLRFAAATERAFEAAAQGARARATLAAIVITLVFGAIVVVLWIGGEDVLAGRLSAGELSSFVFFATVVAGALGGLSDVAGDLQRAAGAAERLFDLLAAVPAIRVPESPLVLPAKSRGAVNFEDVSFAYPSQADRPVLDHLSFKVHPGETVALVGPSGAGKTSVFQLLLRFYDPDRGRLLLDGQPLIELDPGAFRSRIALVPQEPVIFSADAWTNIRYGRPEASDDAVRAAADAAAALEFLEALPEGLSTFLGEKGIRLSGGQRQRLAIARALLCDPALLLLDEATSALDAENERLVQTALERLMRGRTSIVIAHRLATVQRADRIFVMESGRIIDQGRHAELVGRGGLYARLAALQLTTGQAA